MENSTQRDVIAFLHTPPAYGPACTRVERIDTHISAVFLAGDRAYKLKRAVHLPYIDYSTLDLRRAFCEKEVALNRRTAPDLYRGVVAVTRSPGGELAIDGAGLPVEWLVEMRRFDQRGLLDAVARRGELDVALAAASGDAVAQLHAIAAERHDHGGSAALKWVEEENDAELSAAGAVLPQATRARLHDASSTALAQLTDLLDARRATGWVRECHGDAHLGNIFLSGERPVLFDCIEFNDEFSCIDVLYDIAFLVMDLIHRGLPAQANAALNAWCDRLPQYDALPLLPFFLSCRAAIRAKVLVTAAGMADDRDRVDQLFRDAIAYLDRACGLIEPGRGAIVAIGGLSGSGKTTLARAIAADLGRAPGAFILRSDIARKRRFGVDPGVRLPDSAYDAQVGVDIYSELTQSARAVARAGYVALVDAVFPSHALRQQVREAAAREHVPFIGVWLDAPIETMEARLAERHADASDATVAVLRGQHARVTAPPDWWRLDASGPVHAVAGAALTRAATILPFIRHEVYQ